MLTNISWIDYANHRPPYIDFIPPSKVIDEWAKDYKDMQESMFYGETSSFDALIDKLKRLKSAINKM